MSGVYQHGQKHLRTVENAGDLVGDGGFSPDHDEPLGTDYGRNVLRVFERGMVNLDESADLHKPSFTLLWLEEVGIFLFSSDAFSSNLRYVYSDLSVATP